MKKLLFFAVVVAMFATGYNGQKQEQKEMENKNNELTAFDVQKEFEKRLFLVYRESNSLQWRTARSNAMRIGWGGIGNYLGHNRPAVTVYVAPGRYTWEFLEKYPRFTIMQFDDPKVWQYMGKHSGRDGDKATALGLHVAYTENGTPYYEEASIVIECETMSVWHQTEQDFRNDTPKKWYDGFEAGIHSVYVGEVIGAWKRQKSPFLQQNKQMKYYIVDAFTDQPFGGNPAGVVMLDGNTFPNEAVMLQIAA